MKGARLLLGFCVASTVAACDYPFIPVGSLCYYFSSEGASWHDARLACQSMAYEYTNLPVDLAVFDYFPDDFSPVFHYVTLLGNETWWIGGTDEGHENYWVWVDGRPIDMLQSYWRPDEPDALEDQNALIIWYEGSEKVPRRRIGDWVGERRHFYICQLGVKAVT
ncbi:C-type lectin domain family 17, member A-like isoform X1 [Macrobrachium nipponense]|uniref:C-type lectin domain family 17, member A-like isoform X1 n=1 Tax=Macrobrachium nipponense TaxID=159736 RepID=UPI0030C7D9CC